MTFLTRAPRRTALVAALSRSSGNRKGREHPVSRRLWPGSPSRRAGLRLGLAALLLLPLNVEGGVAPRPGRPAGQAAPEEAQPPAEEEPSDPPEESEIPRFTEEVVVVGSRLQPRSVVESAVPIDAIPPEDLFRQGFSALPERLRAVAPSFSVNMQPISDATTVVRPAMLRNLAPDHTLILVNGKRRHRSAVIDWHGGNGVAFGSQGPDLSVIPAIALEQVEILRDAAAAQYGSGAIPRVVNFLLREDREGGTVEIVSGIHGEAWDGETATVAANFGLPLGATGFANLSVEYGGAGITDRSARRDDVAALVGAGNSHVREPAQIWGSPDTDGDLKLFGNFGHRAGGGVSAYGHANHARRTVSGSFFFRNPNTRGGVFSTDSGRTLLIGDVLRAAGEGSAHCPEVRVNAHVPDAATLAQVFADDNCFSFQERFPGGFTPWFGGTARDTGAVVGIRSLHASGLFWDLSAAVGVHQGDFEISDTVNASLGPATPTHFDLGGSRQRELAVNLDLSWALTDRTAISFGSELRTEQYRIRSGQRESWEVGPYAEQGFGAGSNGFAGYSPLAAGEWSRGSGALYGDLELRGARDRWLLGAALRAERFEDFGNTVNGKLSGRYRLGGAVSLRGGVSTGFRAPTPGQQNAFNVSTKFDPVLLDLTERGTIPSIHPVAMLRGGRPLEPETARSVSTGAVVERGPLTLTADFFRIEVEDRLAVTSDFTLTAAEVDQLLAAGVANARGLASFRFFTNAAATTTQGVDLVATWVPRRDTRVRGVLNHTSTRVTRFDRTLLDAERRIRELESALPRNRWNLSVRQRVGVLDLLGRVSYYGAWFDWDSDRTLFAGKPVADLEASVPLRPGTVLALGAQNALNTFPDESPNAGDVGERFSEYTPWGFNGVFFYARVSHTWGR